MVHGAWSSLTNNKKMKETEKTLYNNRKKKTKNLKTRKSEGIASIQKKFYKECFFHPLIPFHLFNDLRI